MSALDNAVKAGIFVDLDALFDTRLAVLDMLDPFLAIKALKEGYLDREEDSFTHCPRELFQSVYKARDTTILERALMTQVKSIVIDFMKEGIDKLKSERTNALVNVYINVWPYKIAKDAAGELLTPFYDAVKGKANIHLVNIPPEELTPDVCKKHFSYIIKYDFMDWIVKLGEQGLIQKSPMQEITLVAPRIYPSGKPSVQDIEEASRNKMEPYQCTELFFAPYIKLELYIPQLFSANIDQGFIEALESEMKKQSEEGTA